MSESAGDADEMGLLNAWTNSGLKARVLVLVLATLVAIAVPASGIFLWIVNGTVVKLGTLFAEKQILFDRYRGLEALMREVSLAETVARAPVIGTDAPVQYEQRDDIGKPRKRLPSA